MIPTFGMGKIAGERGGPYRSSVNQSRKRFSYRQRAPLGPGLVQKAGSAEQNWLTETGNRKRDRGRKGLSRAEAEPPTTLEQPMTHSHQLAERPPFIRLRDARRALLPTRAARVLKSEIFDVINGP